MVIILIRVIKNFSGVLCLIMLGCASRAQTNDAIVRIEFISLSRGYQEQVVITSDSLRINKKDDLTDNGSRAYARKINPVEWDELFKTINRITLPTISDLKSPTMRRSFDGARHSSIIMTTRNGSSAQHNFDDEEPHQKLESLMKAIIKLKETMK